MSSEGLDATPLLLPMGERFSSDAMNTGQVPGRPLPPVIPPPSGEKNMEGQCEPVGDAPATDKEKKGEPVLAAVSALTDLGTSESNDPTVGQDEMEAGDDDNKGDGDTTKTEQVETDDNIPMSFPQKLMDILSDENHKEVISWLPHGKGFMIYHKKKFAEEVMPKYFKKTKFTSFTRKLNRWKFHRITRGPESGAYYHECFQRGNLRLCMQMCCQSAAKAQGPQLVPRNAVMSPNMGAQLNMNNAMSRLQLAPQFATGLNPSAGTAGLNDPHFHLLQQQIEQQRQQLLMQQQQNQQLAAITGIPQSQLVNQQQNMAAPLPNSAMPPMSASAPAPFAGQVAPAPFTGQVAPAPFAGQVAPAPFTGQVAPAPFAGQVAATPAPTPALGSPNQNAVYSRGVVNAAINALERTNQTGYLSMLLAQEKAQAQIALGGPDSISRTDLQRHQNNLLLAQQQQMDLFAKQRMLQAAATTAQQQSRQQQQGSNPASQQTQLADKRAKAA